MIRIKPLLVCSGTSGTGGEQKLMGKNDGIWEFRGEMEILTHGVTYRSRLAPLIGS